MLFESVMKHGGRDGVEIWENKCEGVRGWMELWVFCFICWIYQCPVFCVGDTSV